MGASDPPGRRSSRGDVIVLTPIHAQKEEPFTMPFVPSGTAQIYYEVYCFGSYPNTGEHKNDPNQMDPGPRAG